ncbi:MAG: family 10 glycosylhydrolase [Candidatus Marinimicrobia bacterium]|nr:family 10 glycosylhydrolase [Candidatus Neomarinimicrobiota bacterium]
MQKYLLIMLLPLLLFATQNDDKRKILWVDGSANFARLNSEKNIEKILDRAADVGFDLIILDLKLISGEVLYPSNYAPQILEWKGTKRNKDLNYPKVFIREAHKRNLEIQASINVFSEGWKNKKRGIIYTKRPEWQTKLYTSEGIIPTTEYEKGYSAFVNPIRPEIQEYEIKIIKEIISKYDFDGIVLDRARYDNIKSDFSNYSKKKFEQFIDTSLKNWPEDIFTWEKANKEWHINPGKYYKEWIYWRAKNIHDFFTRVRDTVKKYTPEINFATYVGAWYPSYYKLGVNWAHPEYIPQYEWALDNYHKTGYADVLDYLMTGCYFYNVTIEEIQSINRKSKANQEAGIEEVIKTYHTVEGSAKMSMKVTKGKLPVYGSLYVQQYKDKDNPEQFIKAVKMVLNNTDGIMVFDICHLEDFDWWKYLEKVFVQ